MIFKKNKKLINNELLTYISLITQVGLTFIISLLIFFFLFLYLDKKLQTNGILTGIGTLLGVFSGFYASYKLIKRFIGK
ncbi:MAG TPA: AtpZ/AtpI family protein [Candidatus Cloacimonetes bacterium]|nr:AtpZ/AtpI family protein [Candidatus Cloacimonadota bacterium]